MHTGLSISLEQKQTLSGFQIQSLNILSMTNQELSEFMELEYQDNPMLEQKEGTDDLNESLDNWYEQGITYRENYLAYQEEDCGRRNDIRAPEKIDRKGSLLLQLKKEDYSRQEWKLISYLIDELDDEGFFTLSIDEAAYFSGCPVSMVEKCLADLRELEPVGVFSRNISECVYKQLMKLGETDGELLTIAKEHLEDILAGNVQRVARTLSMTALQLRHDLEIISRMNPKPYMQSEDEETKYINPDIELRYNGDEAEFRLTGKWIDNYGCSDYYIRMLRTTRDEVLREYLTRKLERARLVLNCVDQRQRTLERIVLSIAGIQKEYLLEKGALKPMGLSDVAQMVEMHPSTVCRAIKDKYLQGPRGTVLLKSLFSSYDYGDEEMVASEIKRRIAELIDGEDPAKPLSDMTISKILNEEGIRISRRTVAKYRLSMNILESQQRKYY